MGVESKFFSSVFGRLFSVDPDAHIFADSDPDPGSRNLADPMDLDPYHWILYIIIVLNFTNRYVHDVCSFIYENYFCLEIYQLKSCPFTKAGVGLATTTMVAPPLQILQETPRLLPQHHIYRELHQGYFIICLTFIF